MRVRSLILASIGMLALHGHVLDAALADRVPSRSDELLITTAEQNAGVIEKLMLAPPGAATYQTTDGTSPNPSPEAYICFFQFQNPACNPDPTLSLWSHCKSGDVLITYTLPFATVQNMNPPNACYGDAEYREISCDKYCKWKSPQSTGACVPDPFGCPSLQLLPENEGRDVVTGFCHCNEQGPAPLPTAMASPPNPGVAD